MSVLQKIKDIEDEVRTRCAVWKQQRDGERGVGKKAAGADRDVFFVGKPLALSVRGGGHKIVKGGGSTNARTRTHTARTKRFDRRFSAPPSCAPRFLPLRRSKLTPSLTHNPTNNPTNTPTNKHR